MQVLVTYQIDGDDLRVVMTARNKEVTMVSAVVWIAGAASGCNGNPYLVYGDAVADFTGCHPLDCSINVFGCTSGGLEYWI